jgi:nucleoside-diphosphate-sugar epimerase
MKIVVIRGGFIRAHLAQRLWDVGHDVTVLQRGHDQGLPCDVAIHMYAMTQQDGIDFVQRFGDVAARLIIISSGDVYRAYGRLLRTERNGYEPGEYEPMPLTEDSPLRTVLHPYPSHPDYDKIPVEREVMRTGRGCVLRLPAVYGPGDRGHRIGAWLKRMQPGNSEFLMGDTYAAWRWTHGYVENAAEAIALAALDERSTGRVYNVGEAAAPTMRQRVQQLADVFGWNGRIITVPDDELPDDLRMPYDLRQHMVMDTGRIRRELGYHEPITEGEAIQRTIRWEEETPRASA